MARIVPMAPIVIKVSGMTCEHCVNAVRTEISGLPGVTDVDVDLTSGDVRIVAEPVPDSAALRAAVDAAGYEMAG
jgi:copper chaperone